MLTTKLTFITMSILFISVSIVSAGFFDFFKDPQLGPTDTTDVAVTVNSPPTIVTPPSIPAVDLTTGGNHLVTFSFTAEDVDGPTDLDASSIEATFTKSGEPTRSISDGLNDGAGNDECTANTPVGNQITYDCQITMRYYDDNAADWTATVSIDDQAGETATDNSATFTVNLLREITLSPTTINFPTIASPSSDITSSDNTEVTNLGNWDSTTDGSMEITGYALSINPDDLTEIPATNFRAGDVSEVATICSTGGQPLIQATAQSISSIVLPRGEPTFNTGTITYCLDTVPSGLTSGATYSTSGTSPNTQQWIIGIP
jgi:hypothetical protein